MPTVKTIKPAGGGDFTTLAAWQTFAAAQATADQWAECYGGGNLGPVFLTGWASTPSAAVHPRVYAAPGSRHDGTLSGSSGTNGAFILSTAAARAFESAVTFTELDGLILNKDAAVGIVARFSAHDYTVTNCIFRRNGGAASNLLQDTASVPPTIQNLVYNNIFYNAPTVTPASQSAITVSDGGGAGGRGVFANNTVLNNLADLIGSVFVGYLSPDSWVINNFVYGNNFAGGTVSFSDVSDTGSYEHAATYFRNLDDDGQAQGYGDSVDFPIASGPITDYIVSATDPHPVSPSLLIDHADDLKNDTTFSFSNIDAVGNTRPDFFWDRGAIEYIPAGGGSGRRRRHCSSIRL